jgi:hypothetical protein
MPPWAIMASSKVKFTLTFLPALRYASEFICMCRMVFKTYTNYFL